MYIVTGGAGMIGSALIWQLNNLGIADILVVDNLARTEKWKNLVKAQYLAYMHRDDFLRHLREDTLEEALAIDLAPKGLGRQAGGALGGTLGAALPGPLARLASRAGGKIRGIAHLGACSATTERDADYLMRNNLEYSKILCDYALRRGIRYIQASSAATYGDGGRGFDDNIDGLAELRPLNMYGYSKHLFDLWAAGTGRLQSIASVKFFNVYGPNEYHKGDMRSMVHKAVEQIRADGRVRLFRSYLDAYPDGGQLRDFIYLKDCAEVLAVLLQNPEMNGIFNLGTGQARNWNDLALAVFKAMDLEPRIEYVEMPEALRGKYQYFTQARMERLAEAMRPVRHLETRTLESGVSDYVRSYLLSGDPYL